MINAVLIHIIRLDNNILYQLSILRFSGTLQHYRCISNYQMFENVAVLQ